jgi:uncharacterized protein (DUF427 family)
LQRGAVAQAPASMRWSGSVSGGLATGVRSLVVSYRFTLSHAHAAAQGASLPGGTAIERIRPNSIKTNMARAIWNGKVIAESTETEEVEGNLYFPESSLKREYFRPSSTTSTCPWKGQARYLSLMIDGQDNQDAAWYYPDPKPAARKIKGYVAFWRGVDVEK